LTVLKAAPDGHWDLRQQPLNRIPLSRRLEWEMQWNFELIWPKGRRSPSFKAVADLRENNGLAVAERRPSQPAG
jgi:hypothetical protein